MNSLLPTSTYICPYSPSEDHRLDRQHEVFLGLWNGRLHLCPYQATRKSRVLDVGSGTGAWVRDFAAAHPGSFVIGLDSRPDPPPRTAHCLFQQADFARSWRGPVPSVCNFVHARMLFASIRNIDHFVRQAWDRLAPGGYIEFQDIEFPFQHNGSPQARGIETWCHHMQMAATRRGLDLQLPRHYETALKKAGFVEIRTEHEHSLPIGEWPTHATRRDLGKANRDNVLSGLEGFSRTLLTAGDTYRLDETAYQTVLEDAQRALWNDALEIRIPIRVVWGRKPESTLLARLVTDEQNMEDMII